MPLGVCIRRHVLRLPTVSSPNPILSPPTQTHVALKAMIKEVDEDNDDKISFREFLLIFRKAANGELQAEGLATIANSVDVTEVRARAKNAPVLLPSSRYAASRPLALYPAQSNALSWSRWASAAPRASLSSRRSARQTRQSLRGRSRPSRRRRSARRRRPANERYETPGTIAIHARFAAALAHSWMTHRLSILPFLPHSAGGIQEEDGPPELSRKRGSGTWLSRMHSPISLPTHDSPPSRSFFTEIRIHKKDFILKTCREAGGGI
jgi:hypothetical protein